MDGVYMIMGSANLDPSSFFGLKEVNLGIFNPPQELIKKVVESMEPKRVKYVYTENEMGKIIVGNSEDQERTLSWKEHKEN